MLRRVANPNGGVGTLAYLVSMGVVFLGGLAVLSALRQPKPAAATATTTTKPAPQEAKAAEGETEKKAEVAP